MMLRYLKYTTHFCILPLSRKSKFPFANEHYLMKAHNEEILYLIIININKLLLPQNKNKNKTSIPYNLRSSKYL